MMFALQVAALTANSGCMYLPEVLASGKLPLPLRDSVTHYMIIRPRAKPLDLDTGLAPWRVLHIHGDVVRAIKHMEKQGWVHRCALSTCFSASMPAAAPAPFASPQMVVTRRPVDGLASFGHYLASAFL